MSRATALLAALVLVLIGALHPRHAAAGDIWCWDDPVIEIDGQLVSIDIGVRSTDLKDVRAVALVLTVPRSTKARVVYIEKGAFTPTVQIQESRDDDRDNDALRLDVLMTSSRRFTYQIVISAPAARSLGEIRRTATTNEHERFSYGLPRLPRGR